MEDLSKINQYDWFDCFVDGVVYVKYLNAEAINLLDHSYNVAFTVWRDFDTKKYVQVLEEEG